MIAVVLAVICASTVKAPYGNRAGTHGEIHQRRQQQQQHAGARYSMLPQTHQQAEDAQRNDYIARQTTAADHRQERPMAGGVATGAAGMQQRRSAEMCLLTMESG